MDVIGFELDLVVLQGFVHKPTLFTKVVFACFDRGSHPLTCMLLILQKGPEYVEGPKGVCVCRCMRRVLGVCSLYKRGKIVHMVLTNNFQQMPEPMPRSAP